jgi:HK97 family phage major capsid protein
MAGIAELREERASIREELDNLISTAETESRDLTADEQTKYDELTSKFDTLGKRTKRLEDQEHRSALAGIRVGESREVERETEQRGQRGDGGEPEARSIGERIVRSAEYQEAKNDGRLKRESGLEAELGQAVDRTELRNLISGANPTGGAANLTFIDRKPLEILPQRRPPSILDLINVGTTDFPMVQYPTITALGTGAGMVKDPVTGEDVGSGGTPVTPVQAGVKPETSYAFDIKSRVAQTIATWIPIHRNMLEDVAYLDSLITQQLYIELRLVLENQILSGSGTEPNLLGILNEGGIGTQPKGSDTVADAIYKAITNIRLTFNQPTGILIHPQDWQSVRLSKNAGDGAYVIGSPQEGVAPTLWGLPVVSSPIIAQGTALVGDWQQASLWVRTGANVRASDSHKDYFTRNITTLLAEMRAAFGVIRPQAFSKVTGL